MSRIAISSGTGALVLTLALSATSGSAQAADAAASTSAEGGSEGIEEVVVTANKREENLQQVPLAVSVINESSLEASGVTQFADLGRVAPSLTIRPAEHPVNSNVSLR